MPAAANLTMSTPPSAVVSRAEYSSAIRVMVSPDAGKLLCPPCPLECVFLTSIKGVNCAATRHRRERAPRDRLQASNACLDCQTAPHAGAVNTEKATIEGETTYAATTHTFKWRRTRAPYECADVFAGYDPELLGPRHVREPGRHTKPPSTSNGAACGRRKQRSKWLV